MAQSKNDKAVWSKKREEKEVRDIEVFLSYNELIKAGSMKLATIEHLADKFGVVTLTIYNINRRMKSRIESYVQRHPQFAERWEKISNLQPA